MSKTSAQEFDNQYLRGNYAPVTEEITATNLEVVGELPRELNGRYLRNGPNPFNDVNLSTHHWFVGVCTFSLCCVNKSPIHCDWVAVGIDLLPSSM